MTFPTREDRVTDDRLKDALRRVSASERLINEIEPKPPKPRLDWLLLLALTLDLGLWVGLLAWWIWR